MSWFLLRVNGLFLKLLSDVTCDCILWLVRLFTLATSGLFDCDTSTSSDRYFPAPLLDFIILSSSPCCCMTILAFSIFDIYYLGVVCGFLTSGWGVLPALLRSAIPLKCASRSNSFISTTSVIRFRFFLIFSTIITTTRIIIIATKTPPV